MNYHNPELLEALAARYVVGTMSRRARRRFGLLMDEDQVIAAAVYALEERLLPMAWNLRPVPPSELVWRRIANKAGIGQPTGHRKRLPWLSAAMTAALAVAAIGWWHSASRPPVVETITETVIEQIPVEPAIGIIEDADGNTLWVARLYGDLERVDISVQTAPEQQRRNDYQLWLLRDDGTPVSVGLLPQVGDATIDVDSSVVAALARSQTIAVSLEPLGGSPEPVPTGPVLFTGALLAP